jgi:cytosine/uracil/thiamine/allantoin permease
LQRKVEDMDTKNLPIGREPMMMRLYNNSWWVGHLLALMSYLILIKY